MCANEEKNGGAVEDYRRSIETYSRDEWCKQIESADNIKVIKEK